MIINPNLLSRNKVKISAENQTHRFAYLFVPEGLEEGTEATPFTLHENTIETAKRQYFIGGGTSRKYILSHRNIEQSSFRKEVAA